MRRVLVYEHFTATTPHPAPADSLSREGRAMHDAIVHDLSAVPGVEPIVFSRRAGKSQSDFDSRVRSCDAALIIAPETDGILESLVKRVEAAGVPLLGPSSVAVHLTADKLTLFRHWRAAGVPTPETVPQSERPSFSPPYVLKPRYGCGSEGVRVRSELREAGSGDALIQPFLPGTAASVAFLIGPAGAFPLLPCLQFVAPESNFRYEGGEVPISPALAARAVALGRRAVACVPGLHGYVGVDLVLGLDPHGHSDAAIEINPRLTTSYVGLRAVAAGNLGRATLDVCEGKQPEPFRWKPGRIRFRPDGTVQAVGA
jgi:tyramine---L-glutamate ligase